MEQAQVRVLMADRAGLDLYNSTGSGKVMKIILLLFIALHTMLSQTPSVKDYGASGSAQQTAPISITLAGSTAIQIPTALDFVNGQGVFIQDNGTGKSVGPNASPFCSVILSGGGTTTLVLADAPSVSTSLGLVYHDDGVAEQAAIDAASTANAGTLNWPGGIYHNACAPLHQHSSSLRLVGAGRSSVTLTDNQNFDYGPGFVSTDPPSVYMPAGTFTGAALLSGPGNSYNVTAGAARGYLSLRQCRVNCGELNGLSALTVETTFNITTVAQRVSLLVSSGVRDSVDGYKSAFVLGVEATGALRCALNTNVTGAVTIIGPAGAITANTTHHAALSYDGSNLRCFLDGNQVTGSPVMQTGTVVQSDLEDVRTNGDVRYFPDGGHFLFNDSGGALDGIRISNSARYTANFVAPTAKWNSVDANTWIQCNFDNQPDIFTVCQVTASSGSRYKNVYLPLLGNSCGSGNDNTFLEGMTFIHSDGWWINHNPGIQLTNMGFQSRHNGLLFGGCSYYSRWYDVAFDTIGNNMRYGVIQTQGILEVDNIKFGALPATVGGIFGGNAVLNNLFIQAGGSNPQISLLFRAAGAQTIGGIKPAVIINHGEIDIEEVHAAMITPLMFDQMNGIINTMDLECAAANSACVPLVVNGPARVNINVSGFKGGSAAKANIHVINTPVTKIVINNSQNPAETAWCDVPSVCIIQ